MPDDASINAEISGGAVGVAGAQVVHVGSQTFISNFNIAAPQAEIAKPSGPFRLVPIRVLLTLDQMTPLVFSDREQAIQALVTAVSKRSFTALVGASGSGKSSVVLAGLAPRLETRVDGVQPILDRNRARQLHSLRWRVLSHPCLGGDVIDHLALLKS